MTTGSSHRLSPSALRTPSDRHVFLALTGLWIGLVLVVDPRGDFPLLDDWSYGRSVKMLVEEGRLYYDGWSSPTLFFQVLYGALFCLPFGFSFETLRISTLVAGLAGGIGTYALLRQASAGRFVAVIGSLTVMLNPGYFQHAFTFMTDVPFAALAVVSAVFFLRALHTGSVRDVVIGTILASCATLVRQIGIAIPLGYSVVLLATGTFDKRLLVRSALPLVFTTGVLAVYHGITDYLHLTPALQGAIQQSALARLETQGAVSIAAHAFKLGEALFAHVSLFVLPCLLALLAYRLPGPSLPLKTKRWLAVLSPVLLLILYWRFWPPSLPVRIFGIAHSVVDGQRTWGAFDEPIRFRQTLWAAEFAATALMAFFLVALAIGFMRRQEFKGRTDAAALLFGITTSAFLLAPFVIDGLFMERYLIPVIPFATLVLVAITKSVASARPGSQSLAPVSAITMLLAYGAISITYAHDYLLWNRLRWEAANFLVQENAIAPEKIDGGLSFNGWYMFDADGPLRTRYIGWRFEPAGWWQNRGADYVIGFATLRAPESVPRQSQAASGKLRQIVWSRSYKGWLPGADGAIAIHGEPLSARKAGPGPDSSSGGRQVNGIP